MKKIISSGLVLMILSCVSYSHNYTYLCNDYIAIGNESTKLVEFVPFKDKYGITHCNSFTCTKWQYENYPILAYSDKTKLNQPMTYYVELLEKLIASTKQFFNDFFNGKYENEKIINPKYATTDTIVDCGFLPILKIITKNMLAIDSTYQQTINAFVAKYTDLVYRQYELPTQNPLEYYTKALDEILQPIKDLV